MTLQVRDLRQHFGGVQALRGLSFEINAGECVALIGPNGAGKSTAFACIAGQQRAARGEVWWAGARLDLLSPAQRLARGVARTFQVAQTFEALSVLENVQLLLQAPQGLSAWRRLDRAPQDRARVLLQRVGLLALADADVLSLPYGAKKLLELALALAGLPPAPAQRLLLLDEPAAGLSGAERSDLMGLVKSLAHEQAGAGMAVLYSEHNMDAVFGVADRVLVLIDGQLVAQGTAGEIAQNETVRSRYLGRAGADGSRIKSGMTTGGSGMTSSGSGMTSSGSGMTASGSGAAEGGIGVSAVTPAPMLSVQNLKVWYGAAQALFDVSLQVGAGELLVLQGLNGAGKTTLLHAIMGLAARVTGAISYQDQSITTWPAHQRAQAGIGLVAEDRRLFVDLSVRENLRLAARGDVPATEEWVLGLFPALKTMLHRPAAQMSGGEQQMLAIARTLMTQPRLLLLDEPCEGIAPVLVENIVAALLLLKAQGTALLVAEQNNILAQRADRVITLVAGQLRI
ncbi:MAG: ATP-binding cassette domain-containing protein [Rhodoferax sp.]|uniref:ATP-binding cassette domain-containing protein n=1 Tax=Rhodoferax sp. TaxID=50421 RepID=UPI00261F00A3|nr:ATP-binding cassette domain-containing protein [Rhodoferax sp.]MDD5334142.1 ATP-binding cassette domain-containing protein [Rhodoferax sp.]